MALDTSDATMLPPDVSSDLDADLLPPNVESESDMELPSDMEPVSDVELLDGDAVSLPSDSVSDVGPDCDNDGCESDVEPPSSSVAPQVAVDPHGVPAPMALGSNSMWTMLGTQDIVEYYSPPRVLPEACKRGLRGVFSLDLQTGWDFRIKEHQQLSLDILQHLCVSFCMLSPPCTSFSSLMHMWNYPKMPPSKAAMIWNMGMVFLDHAMDVAAVQVAQGRIFAFEHPASASSWKQACVCHVANLPGVMSVTFDQCMLGLRSKVTQTPMRKRTRILTNSRPLIDLLRVQRCDKSHHHQRILDSEGGVKRSVWAQCYPPGLVNVIVESALKARPLIA